MKELVDSGRTFNARDIDGRTHLHVAVGTGEVERVDAYLHAKINPNARDLFGRTPLHEAVEVGIVEVVSKLIEAGADPNAKNKDRRTPLGTSKNSPFSGVVDLESG